MGLLAGIFRMLEILFLGNSSDLQTKVFSPYKHFLFFLLYYYSSIQLLLPFWDPCAAQNVPVELTLQGKRCLTFNVESAD